jgi:hypothetical protein
MSAHSSRTSIAAPDQDRKEIWRLLVKPLGLLLGLVLAGVVIKTLSGGLNNGLLAQYVVGHGIEGEAFFVAGGALLCAVGLPRQALAFAGGYAFGLKLGFVLAMTAQILGCVVDFFWARAIARDWVRGRLGARLARLDSQLSARSAQCRSWPRPSSAMCRRPWSSGCWAAVSMSRTAPRSCWAACCSCSPRSSASCFSAVGASRRASRRRLAEKRSIIRR